MTDSNEPNEPTPNNEPAPQPLGNGLIRFRAGTNRLVLSAPSARSIYLSEARRPDMMTGAPMGTGRYAVMIDSFQVTHFLPSSEAELALDRVAECVNQALQPPQD